MNDGLAVAGRGLRKTFRRKTGEEVHALDDVTVEVVIRVLLDNADRARNLVRAVVPALGRHDGPCHAGCQTALDYALITAPEARDPAFLAKLDAVAGRVLK